jgi:nicotinamide-nucleotide amidase
MSNAAIIVSGNEVLAGDVLDTNTNWLCKKITGLGGHVGRAVIVRDILNDIVHEIESALAKNTRVIFTTGGMGPTADDLTLEAVAKATNRPLVLNKEALAFVTEKYRELTSKGSVDNAEITPARQKMAILPTGALPLANPVGAAPGVILSLTSSTIICLPGVPTELTGIFEGSLQPELQKIFGDSVYLEKLIIVDCKDESVLAPLLKLVADRHPSVYIKSRAKRFGPDVKFRVTLSFAGKTKVEVDNAISEAFNDVEQTLNEASISIVSVS